MLGGHLDFDYESVDLLVSFLASFVFRWWLCTVVRTWALRLGGSALLLSDALYQVVRGSPNSAVNGGDGS